MPTGPFQFGADPLLSVVERDAINVSLRLPPLDAYTDGSELIDRDSSACGINIVSGTESTDWVGRPSAPMGNAAVRPVALGIVSGADFDVQRMAVSRPP